MLNDSFVDGFYEEDYKTIKGHIVFSCDGCRISLPSSPELKEKFDCIKNQNGSSINPTALTSVLYDFKNKFPK